LLFTRNEQANAAAAAAERQELSAQSEIEAKRREAAEKEAIKAREDALGNEIFVSSFNSH